MNEPKPKSELEKAAEETESPSLLGEFFQFLRQNKKWWLMPMLIVLLLLGLLVVLSGTGFAPFIYSLF